MTKKPLVSIFLPTYNQQDFIAASIDSILEQQYENIEIVIGDDCSTDNTWLIIEEYKKKYPKKIKAFCNHKNLGITGNCNETLKHCTGDYITFTAGDDLFLPMKISKQIEVMEKDKSIALCYHDIEVFNSSDNKTIHFWNHGDFSNKPITGNAIELARKIIEKDTSFMAALSVMTRRSLIPQSGYDQRIFYASDWLMWIDILMNSGEKMRVEYIPDVLARYRLHSSNVTKQYYNLVTDQLITIAIVESKYPSFSLSTNKALREIRYRAGLAYINDKKPETGRNMLILSLLSGKYTWRVFYYLLISYFPSLRKIINLKSSIIKTIQ